MTTSRIQSGDIIACERMGRTFFAKVEDRSGDVIRITPLTKGTSYYHVTARDVKAHWTFRDGPIPLVTKSGAPAWGSAHA